MVAWRCAPVQPPVFCAFVQGLSVAVLRAEAPGVEADASEAWLGLTPAGVQGELIACNTL
jgi:hypothetical protein